MNEKKETNNQQRNAWPLNNEEEESTKIKAKWVGEVQRNTCTQPSPAAPKVSGVWRAPVERE